jgi:hypothetical protein
MALFDSYIFVDWSARDRRSPARPSCDAIWIGELHRDSATGESYFRSRNEACDYLEQILLYLKAKRLRVLLGFDFSYGYSSGFAHCLQLQDANEPWIGIWETLAELIIDKNDNSSNRFEVAAELNTRIDGRRPGPYWGCPISRTISGLSSRSPGFPYHVKEEVFLNRLRISEVRLPGVQESWKLLGVGSVGSQAILGIPRVHLLRHHGQLSDFSKVWPFETGFTRTVTPTGGPFILHAEIWPGIVKADVDRVMRSRKNVIRDQAQVRCLCRWAAKKDQKEELGRFFGRPTGLTDEETRMCIAEEGWILGAT